MVYSKKPPLPREFYERDPEDVAKELLGKILVHHTTYGTLKGKIVETEAYFSKNDPACHFYSKKAAKIFLRDHKAGTAYIYLSYGIHWLFNIITRGRDKEGAVLIRAVEPLEGIELMQIHRRAKDPKNLTSGPGKLTEAFKIIGEHHGIDLTQGTLYVADGRECSNIGRTPRIGISKGKDKLLRFYIKGNDFLSKTP
ncbi:MAG: DNA-3-methyladenine glycosylase [Candidatus Heimdallarchaeota archaeon]